MKTFTKIIVSILIIQLIIIAVYVSYNPANYHFLSYDVIIKTAPNAETILMQEMTSNGTISPYEHARRNTRKGSVTTDVIEQGETTVAQGKVTMATREAIEMYSASLIHDAMKTLLDKNHPQYSPAFARRVKPAYLLQWVPSRDSDMYFQPISGIDAKIYSAFYIDCTPPSVRLFAITARRKPHLGSVYCHYLDVRKSWLESQKGSISGLKDNHQLNHTASAVECPISPGVHPRFVAVSKDPDLDNATNQITVQYPGSERRNFSLCFSPLHSIYNFTFRLVQSVELNRLLGASHFYFYNFSTSRQTDEILRQYEKEGVATILPWPLPHLDTWYYAQILAINDCIYRNRMTSRYVVVVDMDEFIIPSRHSNWMDLINDVIHSPPMRDEVDAKSVEGSKTCPLLPDVEKMDNERNENSNSTLSFGSFMFRCSFLADKSLNQNDKKVIKSENLEFTDEQHKFFTSFVAHPMTYLKRNDEVFDHGKRSKLIIRPETVVSHAIHKTVQHIAGFGTAYVNSTVAYLHHYRPYKLKQPSTLDISALKFKERFYQRLRQAVRKFPSIFHQDLNRHVTGT